MAPVDLIEQDGLLDVPAIGIVPHQRLVSPALQGLADDFAFYIAIEMPRSKILTFYQDAFKPDLFGGSFQALRLSLVGVIGVERQDLQSAVTPG